MKKIVFFAILVLWISTIQLFGQTEPDWGKDPEKAKVMNAKYTDAYRLEKYDEVVEPLEWLYQNAPNLSAGIYIHGEKVYKTLEKEASDASTKSMLQEKLMKCYDLRMENFGKEGFVLNRKAFAAYMFWKNQAEKYNEIYALFQKLYGHYENDISISTHVAYMDLIRKMKANNMAPKLEELIAIYDQINNVIDLQEKEKQDVTNVRETVDNLFFEIINEYIDCDFIQNFLGNELKEGENQLKAAKKIVAFSINKGCLDNPVFVEALEIIDSEERNFGIKKLLAIKADKQHEYERAEKYYQEAIEMCPEKDKKGDTYYLLASHYERRGLKEKSRAAALQSLTFDPELKDAHILIGDLYYNSQDECIWKKTQLEDRLFYLAAYEAYSKANAYDKMELAEKQFPSIEDIFNGHKKEGDVVTVGCWINVPVVLQRRP